MAIEVVEGLDHLSYELRLSELKLLTHKEQGSGGFINAHKF